MSFANEPIPAAAAAAGMNNLVFADDFESLDTIDVNKTSKPGYHWYTETYGETLPPECVSQQDSYIHLGAPTNGAYGLVSYSRSGDCGFTATSGCYLECRMRAKMPMAEKTNGIPAFWTMGLEDFMGRPWTQVGELDVVELFVTDNEQGEKQKYFAGTLHNHYRIPQTDGNMKTVYASNLVNACGYRDQFPFTDDEWHTYAALWEDGRVAWYMDGKLMHSITFTDGEWPQCFYRNDPTPLPTAEEVWPDRDFSLRNWKGAHTIMNRDTGVVFLTSREGYPMDVDWVRIWRR